MEGLMELSVKTSTGREFETRFAGATSAGITQILYIEFIGYSMMDIVPVFSDPTETVTIQGLIDGEVNRTFTGYTKLIESIVLAESGNIRIALVIPMEILGE